MARVVNNSPYHAPVPNISSAQQRNSLETRKRHKKNDESEIAKRDGRVAVVSGSPGDGQSQSSAYASEALIAPVAQMVGRVVVDDDDGDVDGGYGDGDGDGDDSHESHDSEKGEEDEDVVKGGTEPLKAFVEEEDDAEAVEAAILNQFQAQEKAILSPSTGKVRKYTKKRRHMSRSVLLQSSQQFRREEPAHAVILKEENKLTSPINSPLGDNISGREESPRGSGSGNGRAKKLIDVTAISARQEEIVTLSKEHSISDGRPKYSTKKTVPLVEDKNVEEDVEEGGEDGVEEDGESVTDTTTETATETATESLTNEFYEPRAVKGLRRDAVGNDEILIQWKGYPLEKDWTWESVERLRENCHDFLKKWEKIPQNDGTKIYVVERIMGKLTQPNGAVKYQVKWEGYGKMYNTWEPAVTLELDVPHMVEDFEKSYKKPVERRGISRKADENAAQPKAKRRRGRPRKSA